MKLDLRPTATVLAGALLLAGCGKPQTEGPLATSDAKTSATSRIGRSALPADPAMNTNETLSGAAEFARRSTESPFAQAELGLKESFNRALIAFQIGDYARALSELQDLAETPDLTPEQKQAVHDLLTETLNHDPSLASARAADALGKSKPQFAVTIPGTGDSPKNLPENSFSTADPAISESFARAKAAFEIGSYDVALAELQELATNAQLNWQQKYAVQTLLDKTPQTVPGR